MMEDTRMLRHLQVIWDYLGMHTPPEKADCIVGFGNFNEDIPRRAAQLYHEGYGDKILFTGGLGRNTVGLLPESEADRFARVAIACGVPDEAILREDRSTNTKENILFTREMLEARGLPHGHLLGVHQPFMERRICAAFGVYWPEVKLTVTSPQVTVPQYLERAVEQGLTRKAAVDVIVGDFQRMDVYAKLGYQLPQTIPQEAIESYRALVAMGYDGQLVPGYTL